jgi:hypothetical protein
VEKVFNWPGLGRLLVDSVEMRDYPVIQAEVLLFSPSPRRSSRRAGNRTAAPSW